MVDPISIKMPNNLNVSLSVVQTTGKVESYVYPLAFG